MTHPAAQRGFTLLEILVAVAVLSILAATAYAALDRMADAVGHHRDRSESFQALQISVSRLDMDLRQLTSRSIRDRDGQTRPALEGAGSSLEATRAGWANPLQQTRGQLQRLSWQVDGDRLIHIRWPVTDRAPGAEPETTVFLEGVRELAFEYQDQNGQWEEQWPLQDDQLSALPRAIQYRLVLEDGRSIVRTILVEP